VSRRSEYRKEAYRKRIQQRRLARHYRNETEKSLDEETSVMENYSYGKFPKEIQEVADFWRSLYYKNNNTTIQEQILYELSEDGLIENATRNSSLSFSNLTKDYQVLVFESYYGYKSGKCKPKYESDTMLLSMVEAKLIKTPREKEHEKEVQELKKSTVKCWHCDDPNQKILSIEEVFKCTKCGESLWVGEGGYEKKMGVWK